MTVEDYGGEGARGTVFTAPREIPASVQASQGFSVEWKDEEHIADVMILIRPEHGPVPVGSRVTVDGETYRIIKAFPYPDGFRPTHYELMAKTWETT